MYEQHQINLELNLNDFFSDSWHLIATENRRCKVSTFRLQHFTEILEKILSNFFN